VSKTKETREWYESKLDIYGSMKLRVFFIIEMQTIKNASLLLKGSSDVEAIIRAKVPVSQMLGDPGVLYRFLDPAARADIKVIKASGQKFSIGEAVYGVRYAEVRFEYLSSRKLARLLGKNTHLERASLETDTRWIVMGTDAGEVSDGEDDDDEDIEDMIEAKLFISDENGDIAES
jgi:hypothetical protein